MFWKGFWIILKKKKDKYLIYECNTNHVSDVNIVSRKKYRKRELTIYFNRKAISHDFRGSYIK